MRRESNLKRIIPMVFLITLAFQVKADQFENSFQLLLKCESMHIQSVPKDKNLPVQLLGYGGQKLRPQ